MNIPKIPSLDLNHYRSSNNFRKEEFILALGRGFAHTGFVTIRNHGFDELMEAKLYREVKAFFQLPDPVKKKYEFPEMNRQRGYTSFGKEHAKNHNAGDLKEFWHFGQYLQKRHPLRENYPDNVEVEEVPDLSVIGQQAFRTLENIALEILEAIAIYLELPKDFFEKHCRDGNSILRPIHYPAITSEPENAVRAAAHEDINLITLLMGASSDGLQILDKQGNWVPVTAFKGHLVVNVGDMLQRLTNNVLQSTTHRVVNPPRHKWHESRYSIPFFLHPKPDMPLNCLDHCITDYNPRQYDDILAGDYLEERLKEIGLLEDKNG